MKTLTTAISLIALLTTLFTGCEDGSGSNPYADHLSSNDSSAEASPSTTSSESSEKNSIVGTWFLKSSETSWYIHFNKDGSWRITDDKAGNAQRVYGTYTVNGDQFTGPMKNPNVGTGKISGSYSQNTISLYFTEYWHTPNKTIHFVGSR